jgi:hypothetical protein
MACLVRDEDIPPSCIINADQTQVVYATAAGSSWTETGQHQVSILGAEEKRAFTLLVGVSLSGDVLPPQAIYAGKTTQSVPDGSSSGFDAAQKLGARFVPSLTTTYWSNLATMKAYVSEWLVPFPAEQKRRHNLPDQQRCIFQLDCWSVHCSSDFRMWMAETYPWIAFQYVPGGCTGHFQACDVGIQRLLKLAIRRACHDDIVQEIVLALESGLAPSEIVNDSSIGTLRNRSVRWIVEGYKGISSPELVKKV